MLHPAKIAPLIIFSLPLHTLELGKPNLDSAYAGSAILATYVSATVA